MSEEKSIEVEFYGEAAKKIRKLAQFTKQDEVGTVSGAVSIVSALKDFID